MRKSSHGYSGKLSEAQRNAKLGPRGRISHRAAETTGGFPLSNFVFSVSL
jgi:hypothetical protein